MNNDNEDSDAVDEETESYLYSLIHYSQHNIDRNEPVVSVESCKQENIPNDKNQHSQLATQPSEPIDTEMILSRLESIQNTVNKRLKQSIKRDKFYENLLSLNNSNNQLYEKSNNCATESSGGSKNCIVIEHSDNNSSNEEESLYEINRTANSETPDFEVLNSLKLFNKDLGHVSDSSDESYEEESKYCQDIDQSELTMNIQEIVNHGNLSSLVPANKDPWRLLPASTTHISASRYYTKAANNASCEKCLKKGHFTSQCSRSGPVCILCSKEGHKHINCPQKTCHACFITGHTIEKCSVAGRLRTIICRRCHVRGHDENLCPDQWRQYHSTISPGRPFKSRRARRLQIRCCNCGKQGHYQNECQKHRPKSKFLSQLIPQTVARYDCRNIYSQIERKISKVQLLDKNSDQLPPPEKSNSLPLVESNTCTPSTSAVALSSTTDTSAPITEKRGRESQPLGDFVPLVDFDADTNNRHNQSEIRNSKTTQLSKKLSKRALKRKGNICNGQIIDESKPSKSAKANKDLNVRSKGSRVPTRNSFSADSSSSLPSARSSNSNSKKNKLTDKVAKISSVDRLAKLASRVSVKKLKELFPLRTEGKKSLSKNMKRKLRRKLQHYIYQGYIPSNEAELTERLEGWLYDVADGEALTFKKRWSLQNSVSAALQSIEPEYSSQSLPTESKPKNVCRRKNNRKYFRYRKGEIKNKTSNVDSKSENLSTPDR